MPEATFRATDLDRAAAAGLIGPEEAERLKAFLAESAPAAPEGEEELRFIRNFHDVFLAMGIGIFSIGLAVAATVWVLPSFHGAALLIGAGIVWLLGEAFARKRRLFLPAIAICLSFVAFAGASALVFTAELLKPQSHYDVAAAMEGLHIAKLQMLSLCVAGLAAAILFYVRFRLPFSMAVLGLTATAVGFMTVAAMFPSAFEDLLSPLCLIFGLLLFLAGLAFDMRDPERRSRLSDNGFWLHFAAAPLLLNGIFSLVNRTPQSVNYGPFGYVMNEPSAFAAGLTLAAVFVLGLVSLMINRRALVVSALLTTGVAIGALMQQAGLNEGSLFAGTLIVLGGGVLLLGAGWHVVRRALLFWVRPGTFAARVFPPEAPL